MSRKLTPEEALNRLFLNREKAKQQKAAIKERVRLSNEAVKQGLPPDEWVAKYRESNNKTKAAWKAKQPKSTYKPVANSGSFKKGIVPKNKNITEQQKVESKARARRREDEWRKSNKERTNKALRDRRASDVGFRLKCNLRKRLSFLLRLSLTKKTEQTMDLLGCSIDYLKAHLASKFTEGMSFENYGAWHIDHIRACDLFDLTKETERRECFHYTNLQPLWAVDNLKKNNRPVPLIPYNPHDKSRHCKRVS